MSGAPGPVYIGCAGWSIASGQQQPFGAGQSVLERYATVFNAVEINSSFYRPHRRATYQKWAQSVPQGFRFSVKVPKAVTHTARLQEYGDLLSAFAEQVSGLDDKLGAVLVQLPPSLHFEAEVARAFFADLRGKLAAPVVCEPRHASWFGAEAGALLSDVGVARVAADPAKVPEAARPGGAAGAVYYRWHGSPRIYYSSYSEEELARLAKALSGFGGKRWVIFDNTAAGAALDNALELRRLLSETEEKDV